MPTPNQRLAASLSALRRLQRSGRGVFRSGQLSRVHRERLLRNGFVQEVMKGWLISSNPSAQQGDSTPWYASFWEFCARYCEARFGDEWHLSPEHSLLLHAENTVVPTQAVIYSPSGTNNKIDLPFGTSIYDLKHPHLPRRWLEFLRPCSLAIPSKLASFWQASEMAPNCSGVFWTADIPYAPDVWPEPSGVS